MTSEPTRTPLHQLLEAMQPTPTGYSAHITPDWLQGRAIYGGLSTALCLAAALRTQDDLPPLRSAEVSFLRPAGPDVEIEASVMRQGKSITILGVELASAAKTAVTASFYFGTGRASRLACRGEPGPDVQGPGQYPPLFPAGAGPGFARQFEVRQAAGPSLLSGADEGDICAWVRHKDRAADDTLVGLVALADALPPAAMTMFDKRAAISTMTWHLDLLTDNPQTDDGWWLCRSTTETALDGYSTQRMAIWNAAGEAVIRGRQNIAIFF